MTIVIDPTPLMNLGAKHPLIITLYLIKMFGWMPIIFVIIWGLWKLWINFIQDEYASKIKYILLAIDVPRENEQTPKAVEQIFAHLAGAHSTPNFIEQYWEGVIQPAFSLEIVSIDGYVQFLIHTPEASRDLVEAAIYAQYPDAEIVEVEDYTDKVPQKYPDPEWDLWGTELILVKKDCFPLKSYIEFEHQLSQDMKDPMAALLEIMSRMRKGEQVWIQIIILPIDQNWKNNCDKEVKKIIKEEIPESKKGIADKVLDEFLGGLNSFAASIGELIVPGGVEPVKKKEEKKEYNIWMNLTDADKSVVGAIQNKSSKIGYRCKIRQMYLGKKEVFFKPRGVSGVFGAIKQFNTNDRNALKPEKKIVITKINYFFKKKREAIRKTKIIKAYKNRSLHLGTAQTFVFNIEELATLWHFPMLQVKAPLIKKTGVKKVEPPMNLPMEEEVAEPIAPPAYQKKTKVIYESGPPENLPFA